MNLVLFREICASTNIRLKIALSIETDATSYIDVIEQANNDPETINETGEYFI